MYRCCGVADDLGWLRCDDAVLIADVDATDHLRWFARYCASTVAALWPVPDAVRDYLVSKGVPRDKIETLGMGKTQPVPGVVCKQKNMKELIACYAPDRRVEVEVKGEGRK